MKHYKRYRENTIEESKVLEQEIETNLKVLFAESKVLEQEIENNLKNLKYE